jgi:hypothetical protein
VAAGKIESSTISALDAPTVEAVTL